MGMLSIGIVDQFHPKILETISRAIRPEWRLVVAENEADRARALAASDIVYVMGAPLSSALLDAAPSLCFIQKLGAGVDRIDLERCAARGITVARLQAGNSVPVAEHTVLMMLAACRRLPLLDRQTRSGAWDKEAARGVSRQINGKTVGLVGFGAIGKAVARILSGFGATILYYDPYRAPEATEAAFGVEYASLDALAARSDIVSLHLPLSSETRNLFDASRIGRMKTGSILVNCARGGLVDEAALAQALESGQVYAAAIDAFQNEPPVGSPLLTLEQTVVTPHTAGGTVDNFESVIQRAVLNTKAFLEGRPIPKDDLVLEGALRLA